MNTKIILDDRRPMDEVHYRCVRTYEDCVYSLKMYKALGHPIEYISLDYDLGTQKTGYDVLEFMLENGNEVEHINIHSDHSVGVPKMREFAQKHFPDVALTFNSI